MDEKRDGKRKKDKQNDDDDDRREKRSKRPRSRPRSSAEDRDRDSRRKRRHSRSKSPDKRMKQEERRGDASKESETKKEATERKNKDTDMLNTRTGGAYIPPARLRMMQAQITDKSSVAYQRLAWEALKKSIHGHINKINVGNIGIIIKELLKENIVRGRGLLCRSVIQAQAASPTFTNVYAALVAAVNSRFPNIGELLLKRLVIQFKRGFKRNDKPTCISSASFIAHLVNQRVAHEILALELLTLLVETPTDDSVEVAIAFLKECGQKLTEVSSKGVNAIFEMLRNILHEGQLDKRVQYMIEVMFQVWKDGFKDHPALLEELELVPEEEQFTHLLMLDDATDPQDILNVFKFDDKYEENEQKYKTLSKEILGSDADSDEEGSGESGSEESEEEEEAETDQKGVTIIDNTETNLVALRRTIYLTINSSLDFEECAHKLMKMQLKPGQEVELCHMFLDCCAEQRTYEKFYGLLAQRFCNINRIYIGPFEEIFRDSYATAHRLDTNRLRNVSKFFAHLLFTDSIGWEVLECVKLNEEDTTSSSRIYIKILFQELAEYMGLKKLNDRLKDPTLQEAFGGIFPRDNPKNTRFSINFFTSIGLGGLTDELREHLKQMPKNVPPPVTEINLGSESSSDTSSSSSSSSDSSSDSSSSSESEEEEEENKRKKKKKKGESDKDKHTPKTPEQEQDKNKDVERWGHDGFYDTYGKDARRFENKDRPERARDNFAKPRDVRGEEKRDYGYRNGGGDRREARNRQEDDRRNRDDRRKDDRNGDRENRDDDRRNRDERHIDREDSRRREGNGDRNREGDDRRNRDERRRDDRYVDREESRKHGGNEDRNRDDGRRNRDDKRRDERNTEREDPRRNDYENKSKNDDRRNRDVRCLDERNEERAAPKNRDDNEDRRSERTGDRRGKGDNTRSRREDSDRVEEEQRYKKKESRRDDKDDRGRSDKDRRKKDDSEPSADETQSRKDKDKKGKNKNESKSKSKQEVRNNTDSESDTDSDSSEDESRKKTKKDKKKNKANLEIERKSKRAEKNKETDTDSGEDESKSKRNKQKRKEKHRDDRPKRNEKEESESESSEDERSKKKKGRKKDKNKHEEEYSSKREERKKRDTEYDSDESNRQQDKDFYRPHISEKGWDIRRDSSVRREVTTGRYWDNN